MRVDEISEVELDPRDDSLLKISQGSDMIEVNTHKAREFYECFKFIFNVNEFEEES